MSEKERWRAANAGKGREKERTRARAFIDSEICTLSIMHPGLLIAPKNAKAFESNPVRVRIGKREGEIAETRNAFLRTRVILDICRSLVPFFLFAPLEPLKRLTGA